MDLSLSVCLGGFQAGGEVQELEKQATALQVSEEWRLPLAVLLQSARRAAQFGLLQLTVPALPEATVNGHGGDKFSWYALFASYCET